MALRIFLFAGDIWGAKRNVRVDKAYDGGTEGWSDAGIVGKKSARRTAAGSYAKDSNPTPAS
ncbi:hypothetical protein NicSoilB11_04650 [Arthrobacter sp. NicSoilB11]|nr:hypothetical protein StoSoilB19_04350 [Arthrobacter sp. StoSoilB19]BCW74140.1 hypothetical protein NicSoilB11_04650 [Arthrobacter sp. NicSoilB11]